MVCEKNTELFGSLVSLVVVDESVVKFLAFFSDSDIYFFADFNRNEIFLLNGVVEDHEIDDGVFMRVVD